MTPSTRADARAAGRIVLAGLVLLFAFTALYVTAFHAPRPRGVDIGFVGAPALGGAGAERARRRRSRRLRRAPLPDESAARAALLDTDVRGVLVAGAPHDRVLVAQALGAAPTQTVTSALVGLAAHSGAPAVVQDLRPLPADDRRGLSTLFTVIGTLIPSLVFGVLLSVFGRGLPAACAGPRSPPTPRSPGWWRRSTWTSSSARSLATSPGIALVCGSSHWR